MATAHGTTVIIGAGPHGLAAAAHLRAAGVRPHTFGEPLEFWRAHMPAGMILRSRKRSSNVSDPARALTIERYEHAQRRPVHAPNLTLDEFIAYGTWFQRQAVPDLDRRKVTRLERRPAAFALTLSDGERLEARNVVVAAGLAPFPWRPPEFAGLPAAQVSHTGDHTDLAVLAGRRVAVIGAGQSALESAALLAEAGASVELLARTPEIHWLPDGERESPAPWDPPTDVGDTVSGWLAAAPDVFRRLPRTLQPALAYRCIRPAGSGWLRPRLRALAVSCSAEVLSAQAAGGAVRLGLSDGTERIVDHVLLGTGYRVDVRRYPFLDLALGAQLRVVRGYPVLRSGLESSIPGLHFVGAPAAYSFGPITRFVVGTWYTAPALTRHLLGRKQPPVRFSF